MKTHSANEKGHSCHGDCSPTQCLPGGTRTLAVHHGQSMCASLALARHEQMAEIDLFVVVRACTANDIFSSSKLILKENSTLNTNM